MRTGGPDEVLCRPGEVVRDDEITGDDDEDRDGRIEDERKGDGATLFPPAKISFPEAPSPFVGVTTRSGWGRGLDGRRSKDGTRWCG